ncbi:MAG TPA: response regulator transcription factor [Anaerolineae bacterium]|nr:response regulator transcription factor [Anaerolineae bacterium]
MQKTILVVDDDDLVALAVQRALKKFGYHVLVANSGRDGIQMARRYRPDLIVMDVIMPGITGYQAAREVRNDPMLQGVPLLFLTAKAEDEDKIEGLMAGADDYMTKPFNMEELHLRVRAILRRALPKEEAPHIPNSPEINVGEVMLDTRTFQVTTDKGVSLLTNVQFDLLYHLMINAGQIFTTQQLLQDVWNYPPNTGSPELVRAHIRNLREKIESVPSKPRYVRTIQGHGYTFVTAN